MKPIRTTGALAIIIVLIAIQVMVAKADGIPFPGPTEVYWAETPTPERGHKPPKRTATPTADPYPMPTSDPYPTPDPYPGVEEEPWPAFIELLIRWIME